jgi:hypothetical protein
LAITSPTSGGSSVGIVHSQTQAMEFSFFLIINCSEALQRECYSSLPSGACYEAGCVAQVAVLRHTVPIFCAHHHAPYPLEYATDG